MTATNNETTTTAHSVPRLPKWSEFRADPDTALNPEVLAFAESKAPHPDSNYSEVLDAIAAMATELIAYNSVLRKAFRIETVRDPKHVSVDATYSSTQEVNTQSPWGVRVSRVTPHFHPAYISIYRKSLVSYLESRRLEDFAGISSCVAHAMMYYEADSFCKFAASAVDATRNVMTVCYEDICSAALAEIENNPDGFVVMPSDLFTAYTDTCVANNTVLDPRVVWGDVDASRSGPWSGRPVLVVTGSCGTVYQNWPGRVAWMTNLDSSFGRPTDALPQDDIVFGESLGIVMNTVGNIKALVPNG